MAIEQSNLTVASVSLPLSGRMGLQGILDETRAAVDQGAELVVLPECAILGLLEPDIGSEDDTPRFLLNSAHEWLESFSALAKKSGSVIIAGTIFETFEGGIANICPICLPNGEVHRAVKNRLTTYEREVWKLVAGHGLTVVDEPPFGVAICYDSEFPEACRAIAEAGAKVICVPSYTENYRGHQRVRWSCQARAVENQVFVLHASLIANSTTSCSSAILCPSIEPFPESAVLAETEPNEPGFAIAKLDFKMLEHARSNGDVRNWNDRIPLSWPVNVVESEVPHL